MLNAFINIYGETLLWNTPFLCGLALGIYGLTNAAFQISYGSLSDRVDRKPVILYGACTIGGRFVSGLFCKQHLSSSRIKGITGQRSRRVCRRAFAL